MPNMPEKDTDELLHELKQDENVAHFIEAHKQTGTEHEFLVPSPRLPAAMPAFIKDDVIAPTDSAYRPPSPHSDGAD